MRLAPDLHRRRILGSTLLGLAGLLGVAACSNNNSPAPAAGFTAFPPDVTPRTLARGDDLPGIVLDIVAVTGGSGGAGRFLPGDKLAVHFTAHKTDGGTWSLAAFDEASILISGPTGNYQRVVPEQHDLTTRTRREADGSFVYSFAAPLPAVYLAPLNDSTAFDATAGELTGEALQQGTYTVGLNLAWDCTIDGEVHRDAGTAVADFLVGSEALAEARDVVRTENCASCHQQLRAHGQPWASVTNCLLCHTAGAEDANLASVANGTPGVAIDFRVMIHRLHNGSHLPSVLGVSTLPSGARNYAATPAPLQYADAAGVVHDYSAAAFPMMPSAYVAFLRNSTGTTYLGTGGNGPMPRDLGYTALTGNQKELEDRMRTATVACAKCHGDPDDDGPLGVPAQADLIWTNPTQQACGSCHDDVMWGQPYAANGQTMGAQANNQNCILCHSASGAPAPIRDVHVHPYENPAFNTGVNVDFTAVGGGSGAGGNHLAGDPILATFTVKNDAGTDLPIVGLTRLQLIVTGPHGNPQWVLPNVNAFDFAFRKSSPFTGNGTITVPQVAVGATAQVVAVVFTGSTSFDVVGSGLAAQTFAIGAGSGSQAAVAYGGVTFTVTQGSTAFVANDRWYFEVMPPAASYTVAVPRDFTFERLGVATGAAQTLAAGNAPVYWGRQVVYERTALVGAASSLGAAAVAMQRYVVADQTLLAGIAVGDRVVLDAGTATEEYVQVARIQTTHDSTGADLGTADRFFFTQFLRYDHGSGAAIQECTLTTRREGTDYTMAANAASGIDLVAARFVVGNPVVMSYRSDARFGYYRGPGEALQAVYTPATGDSDEVVGTDGDWTALPIVDGTYQLGAWANIDFTLNPQRTRVATEVWNNLASDNTTYRMISPPATRPFLFGAATTITRREVIADVDSCKQCHGEIVAHGFGRRGLETCLLCHATPGAEDAPLYSFNGWYIGPTPRVSMEFRTLLHKVHMGRELANASSYTANGIFLGTPYPVQYGEIEFPAAGGPARCEVCHGSGSTGWHAPAGRDHPNGIASVREWRAACTSCHDSTAAGAHVDTMTSNGQESCSTCHGLGKDWPVDRVHRRY